jgi:hypothetical protein
MKLIDRYEFTNGRAFEVYYLEPADIRRFDVPECDVIGLRRVSEKDDRTTVMRPDEALVQARLLIDAVHRVSEGYAVGVPRVDHATVGHKPLAMELVDDLKEADPQPE